MDIETAIFASGCFWGTEFYFQKAEGVISTSVGYIGGSTENPTYQQFLRALQDMRRQRK